MNFEIIVLCSCVCGYLFGGINGAIILSTTIHKMDIREHGSKNPGFTNYKRVFGNEFSTWCVMLIDILKTLIPVLVSSIIFEKFFNAKQLGAAITGLACMVGHAYPVWYKFKGGKTFMSMATAIWFVDVKMAFTFLAVFAFMLFTIKFMSLSSMTAAASCPVSLLLFKSYDHNTVIVLMFIAASLLIWRHKANIVRLLHREESKFSLFGKKKSA